MREGEAGEAARVLARCAARLRASGRTRLLEDDGLDLADALGLRTPARIGVRGAAEVEGAALAALPGKRVVVKVVSPDVVHRSRAGAMRVVPRDLDEVRRAVDELAARFGGDDLRFLVEAFVEGDEAGELLLGVRRTEAWGPVVVVAPGGVRAEARSTGEGGAGPWMTHRRPLPMLSDGLLSGVGPAGTPDGDRARDELTRIVGRLLGLASGAADDGLAELEFNPVRRGPSGWTALDALGRLAGTAGESADGESVARASTAGAGVDPERVLALLRPRSVAVVGASARTANPGRIILRNLLEAGFDPGAIRVVKAGVETLEGCVCVSSVEDLAPVDLLVVAVAAAAAADVVETVVTTGAARALLLVSGGMEIGAPGARPVDRVVNALEAARRARPDAAPVLVGPNSLGLRSLPGRIDTLFLPRDRIRFPGSGAAPVALVSQSGAFAMTRLAALPHLDPRYVVTLGNQGDVTLGCVAEALALDPDVRATAWYVEGFAPGDGARWLEALQGMVAEGRPAVVYAAGRTAAGRDAAASHTASVAGDPVVLRGLCRNAGIAVVDSLDTFEDTLALLAGWASREEPGPQVAVLSNAGFETVAAADGAVGISLPDLAPATRRRLTSILEDAGLADLVPVVHPLDVTPMLADGPFVAAAEALLADPGVDVGVVGCVPLTPALSTPLDGGEGAGDTDVTSGLVALWRRTRRPWLVVLDAGPGHAWMRERLRRAGIPVLCRMDRVAPALRAVLGR